MPDTDAAPRPAAGPGHEADAARRAAAAPALEHVSVWLFDLDNTLYPASCNLFAQIERRMGAFICELVGCGPEEARALQKTYFREHGTTMRGLMDRHGVDPEAFLAYVHEIDLSPVAPAPALDAALAALAGRKVVFTNASVAHAERVLGRLGIAGRFECVFDIAAAGYLPKPDAATYRRLAAHCAFEPRAAALFDDMPRNLAPAAALGMTTVWLRSDTEHGRTGEIGDHIHHVADDLVAWLEAVIGARRAGRAAPALSVD